MAADGTIFRGLVELDVQDNGVAAKVQAAINSLQQEFERINSLPGINLGASLTQGLVASLESAGAAVGLLEGQVVGLHAAQAELAAGSGGPGSAVQTRYINELIGDYQRLIGVLAEYQALASRGVAPPWAVSPVARASAAATQAVAQGQYPLAPQVAAIAPYVESPADIQRRLGYPLAPQVESISYTSQSGGYRGGSTVGLVYGEAQKRALEVAATATATATELAAAQRAAAIAQAGDGNAIGAQIRQSVVQRQLAEQANFDANFQPANSYAPLGDRLRQIQAQQEAVAARQTPEARLASLDQYSAAIPANASSRIFAVDPAGTATVNRSGVLSERIAQVQAETLRAEEQTRTAAFNRATGEQKLAAATEETSRRELLAGSPAQFQQAVGIDSGDSAKRRLAALDVQRLETEDKRAALGIQSANIMGQAKVSEEEYAVLTQKRVVSAGNLLRAQQRLEGIVNAEGAKAEVAGSGGGGGGFFGSLGAGSGGSHGGSDIASQAGFALKYYAFYQVFNVGAKLMGEVKTSTEEYSLAVNQLTIALGGNQERAQALASTYSSIGQSLATSPIIAVDAATKFTRFFRDQSGISGDVGAQLGSTVNLLEGAKASGAFGDPAARAKANDKTLGELGAIAQNYGLGAQGASGLYDASTLIAQHYGQQLGGSLLAGTAQIADLLKQSGFTPEQGLALVGSVTQYTGNTSEMAAGDLKRFLGRQGSTAFRDIFAEFQVDQNQSLRDELVQLGSKFQTLSETQRGKVISTLGGGRAGAAVVAAITDLPDQTTTAAAGASAIGLATEQANARLATFAGRLEQIGADWSLLAKDIGTSGLGQVFGSALTLIDPLLRGVDSLVRGFSVLPGYVKDFVEALALASVAGKVLGGSFGLAGVTGALTKIGGTGAEVVSAEATAARVAALGLDTAATTANAAAQGADAAAIELNTVAAAENAVAQGGSAAATAVSSTGLIARLGALGTAAGGAAVALGPIVAIIGAIALLGQINKSADLAKDGAQQADDAFKARASAKTPEQIKAAADLANVADAKLQSSRDVTVGGDLLYGLNSIPLGVKPAPKSVMDVASFGSGLTLNLDDNAGPTGLEKSRLDLQAQLRAMAADNGGLSEPRRRFEDVQKYFTPPPGTGAAKDFGSDYTDVDRGIRNLATTHASVATSIAQLKDELAHIPDSSLGDLLTPQTGAKGVSDEVKRLTTQIGHSNDPTSREADLGLISGYAQDLLTRANATGTGQEAAEANADSALKAYHQSVLSTVKAKIASIHALQSNNASSQAQLRGTITAALTEFAKTGDVDSVVALLAGVDKAFIATFNAGIAAEKRVLADQAAALQAAAGAAANVAIAASADSRQQAVIASRSISSLSPAQQAVQDKIASDAKIQATLAKAAVFVAPTGADFSPKSFAGYQAPKTGPSADQIEEARLASLAIPGDPLSAAATSLRVAQYKMSEPKNAVEYWTALKSLHDAQYAYAQAQLVATNDADLLGIDLTDPLATAKEKVREASRVLSLDRGRGALADVTNKDELALKQAKNSAEKTAFEQQFSDQQTNYNLQRESLSAYLSYLRSQHDYLTNVHNKTRQQVDELNQVDQALKSLGDSLQGQFNLGQIKVPTPYEARRIEAGGGQSTTNVQITISGADIPAIKGILAQYLGQGVMAAAGTSVRKV